jgi:protein-S-isoprenylcysteine O-methyltransferase Ste14
VISVSVFVGAELVAGAVLALWVVARYPRLGPKSLRSALAVVGAAFVLLQLSTVGATPLLGLPHGAYVTLFVCVLPSFFAVFASWLDRSAARAAAAVIAPRRLRVANPVGARA